VRRSLQGAAPVPLSTAAREHVRDPQLAGPANEGARDGRHTDTGTQPTCRCIGESVDCQLHRRVHREDQLRDPHVQLERALPGVLRRLEEAYRVSTRSRSASRKRSRKNSSSTSAERAQCSSLLAAMPTDLIRRIVEFRIEEITGNDTSGPQARVACRVEHALPAASNR
jgi:hypothetical protein